MATNWTLTNPIDHTLNPTWPREVRELKELLRSRLYYTAAAPTTRPAGTAFEAGDVGSIWIDSDDNKIHIMTSQSGGTPTWTDFEVVIEAMTLSLSAVLTQAEAPVFTKGIVANNSYLVGRNQADDGNVDLIKVGTNDLPTLPDSAEMASNAAPVEDEAISNKKYVDTKEAVVVTQATASLFGPNTDQDTTPATLTETTIYQAQCDGFLTITHDHSSDGAVVCYVEAGDATPDVVRGQYATNGITDKKMTMTIPIVKGEYLQVTAAGDTPDIYWTPFGTGGLVDQT